MMMVDFVVLVVAVLLFGVGGTKSVIDLDLPLKLDLGPKMECEGRFPECLCTLVSSGVFPV